MNRVRGENNTLLLQKSPISKIIHNQEATSMPQGSFLNSICQDRIDELGKKLLFRKDYKSIYKSCHELSKLLEPTLTEKQKQLISLLDEEQGRMLALYEDFYYQGGFIDGCSLGSEIIKNNFSIKKGKSHEETY